MKPDKLRVAISGFDGLDVPHPGGPVARALRESWPGPIEIHALGYDPFMTGAWMGGAADELHTLPDFTEGDAVLLERLVALTSRFGFDAFIPTLDLEIPVIARLAGRLEAVGLRTLLPSPEAVYATSKLRLPKFCHDHSIPTPRTIHVLDQGDLPLHADQFGYPMFIKGTVAGAKRAANVAQATAAARGLNRTWGGGVLLQEVIEGEEYNVAAVLARDHSISAMVSIKKVGVNEKGKGVMCTVVDDPAIERHAVSILEALDWCGPVELEFVLPKGAKAPSLIEVNCRFPSWILLSHWADCSLPVVLLQEILGQRPGARVKARPGTSFVRDIAETAVPLAQLDRLARFGSVAGQAPAPTANRRADPDGLAVAVTGVSTLDVVNAGLGVARALRMAPDMGRLYGLGYGTYDSGLYRSELFDATFRLPASDDPGALYDRLAAIHGDNPFDVVVPSLDGEIPRFIEIADRLEALGVATLLPSAEAFARRGKDRVFTDPPVREPAGFAIPDTIMAKSEVEATEASSALGYPVVLKGVISHALPASSAGEVRAAWSRLREKGCAEALVQRFVDGERFAVSAVCDRASEPVTMLTIKKLRICDRGSTWSAISVPQPALEAGFADFLRALRWVGPVEGEFIRDEVTERFHLIEVNPRFTAWIAFSAHLGINHPYAAVRAARGLPVIAGTAAADLVFMRSCEDAPITNSAFAAIATKGALKHA
jgi:carbamoyl-phosphate synthase large subunit